MFCAGRVDGARNENGRDGRKGCDDCRCSMCLDVFTFNQRVNTKNRRREDIPREVFLEQGMLVREAEGK